MPDQDTRDSLRRAQQTLVDTRLGKIEWRRSESGEYIAEREKAVAVLTRSGERRGRVRLEFQAKGRIGVKTRIEQVRAEAEPFPYELELDSALALLYQEVEGRLGADPDAADLFYEE